MNPYKEILRKFFSKYVSTLRKRRGLTQEEMAEKLRITGRAYSDLERGIYCCCTGVPAAHAGGRGDKGNFISLAGGN